MIERLRNDERSPQDPRFYEHELLEAKHMKKRRQQGLYRSGYEKELSHFSASAGT